MKFQIQSLTFFFLITINLSAQITFHLKSFPDHTPLEDTIYLAGNFNNWNPKDPDLAVLLKNSSDRSITIYPKVGKVEYKFTRGTWQSNEGNSRGGFLPNRELQYRGEPMDVDIQIWTWEDNKGKPSGSTASPNVYLLEDNFYIPQLDRYRRISILLPYSYFASEKRYPVLYMQDGQNLFDTKTSFSGEWSVDETVNQLAEQGFPEIIVVGVDNGGEERMKEFTVSPHPEYGGGQGAAYIQFLAETLKPYIDAHYRTLPDAENTGIAGSSLGGLISMHAFARYRKVFGKAGIFSPSFWWSEAVYLAAADLPEGTNGKVFLLGSQKESPTMSSDLYAMAYTLYNAGLPGQNIYVKATQDGAHSEWYWARELPEMLKWLFPNTSVIPEDQKTAATSFSIKKNKKQTRIRLKSEQELVNPKFKLFKEDGTELDSSINFNGRKLKLPSLEAGKYFLGVYEGEQLVGFVKMIPK